MEDISLTLRPIGHIHTPFSDRYDAPRQPEQDSGMSEGEIVLHPHCNYEQAVEDLAGFERIWLIYWFDRNPGWKPKVLPPRGERKKRGVFATRSPHRPNPIGLSLVRLISIAGRTLRVGDNDLLDGTPILDIKPYLPYAEAFPESRAGWLDEAVAAAQEYHVEWSAEAAEQCEWLRAEFAIDLRTQTVRVLQADPFPHPYRRVTELEGGLLVLAMKSWRIVFTRDETSVMVVRIESGYSRTMMKSDEPLHERNAHEAFHRRWPQQNDPL